ncbi:hypothetical protein FHW88_003350 [Mucilaginibacter sp. SG538B]|uniref:hypothetical protein n=1 Tax=Mucilaginibacter sp. SG538B TaxID=2587021 RepID=UPI00159D4824|nr:hypothetical protein [Mucilaginibacter sp. SG538B]NVM65046.1 hypothetical protein [Mucilaginibacter sp. SG538B]
MPENSDSKLSSRLIALIPVISLMVLLNGAAKQFMYYYNFNLDIFSFLEITELLPQTIFDLFTATFYLLFGWVVAVYYANKIAHLNNFKFPERTLYTLPIKSDELKLKIISQKRKFRNASTVLLAMIIGITILSIIILHKLYNDVENPNSESALTKFLYLNMFHLYLISYITVIVATTFLYFRINKERTLQILVTFSIFLITSGLFNGIFKYNAVVQTNSHRTYSIKIGNNIIASDNEYYYIGKCKSFVFFYCTKDNLVTAYSMATIVEMSVGSD